jgi:hypothetical protein
VFRGPVDPRRVHVIYDSDGNSGKSTFCRMMAVLHDDKVLTISTGKSADIHYIARSKQFYTLIQMDISRDQKETVNLNAIESLKNGQYANHKYKGSEELTDHCHIFIYTNNELKWSAMTTDRWEIIHLDKDQYEEGYKTYTYAEFVAAGLESPLGNIDTASSGETSNDNCD